MPGDSNTVSQTPSQEEFQTQMNTDFKLKDSSMFTGTWGDQARWPRLLVFCDSPIPLSHQVYKTVAGMNKDGTGIAKSMRTNLIVIDCVDESFTKVPLFKDGNSFKTADGAKPFSKLVESERLGPEFKDIQCWPWTLIRENPQAKGQIKDGPDDATLAWRLQPGMVIQNTIWEDSMKGFPSKDKKMTSRELVITGIEGIEGDVIPAFTPMVAQIAIKAWCPRVMGEEYIDAVSGQKKNREAKDLSPVMRQYGIGVADLRVVSGSIYSCMPKIRQAILSSHVLSLAMQKEHVERNWAIANCLQNTQAPMLIRDIVPDAMFLENAERGIIAISMWSIGGDDTVPNIHVRNSDVMRFTNCGTVEEGVAMMEFACQAGCLEMLCMHNKYLKKRGDEYSSEIYGVPIIDTAKLLACVKVDRDPDDPTKFLPVRICERNPDFVEYDADYRVTDLSSTPGKLYRPKIIVSKEPVSVTLTAGLPCPDLCLVGTSSSTSTAGVSPVSLDRAYVLRFINTSTGGLIFSAYFNASRRSTNSMHRSAGSGVLGGEGSQLVRRAWSAGKLGGGVVDPFGPVTSQSNTSTQQTQQATKRPAAAGSDNSKAAKPSSKTAPPTPDPEEEEDMEEDDDDDDDEATTAPPPAKQAKTASSASAKSSSAKPSGGGGKGAAAKK